MRKRVARKVLFGKEGYAVVHRSATIDRAHHRLKPVWRSLRVALGYDRDLAIAYLGAVRFQNAAAGKDVK